MIELERDLKEKPQVFVSYASADSAAARGIVEGLCSRDLNVWLDVLDLLQRSRHTKVVEPNNERLSVYSVLSASA